MVEDKETPNTASWYVNGSFLSAWYSTVDGADLPESAAAFVEMSQDPESRPEAVPTALPPWSPWVDCEESDPLVPGSRSADVWAWPVGGRGGHRSPHVGIG